MLYPLETAAALAVAYVFWGPVGAAVKMIRGRGRGQPQGPGAGKE
jgi:hypothetical protein